MTDLSVPLGAETTIRVGVAGLGYWGPNLARNFASIPGCELVWCCDGEAAARSRAASQFPGVQITAELDDLLGDPSLHAIVLATPVPTHAELAVRRAGGRQALLRREAARRYQLPTPNARSTPPRRPDGR